MPNNLVITYIDIHKSCGKGNKYRTVYDKWDNSAKFVGKGTLNLIGVLFDDYITNEPTLSHQC